VPKKVYKIEAFEGGINQLGDPRDIDDNQFEELFNADVSRIGKITLPGNALQIYSTTNIKNETANPDGDINSMGNNSGGLTPGYGLFAFSHDFNMQGLVEGDNNPDALETDFICINDGAHIDIWDSCHNTAGENLWIQSAIKMGSVHLDSNDKKVKPIYYKADNGVRVCDANFGQITLTGAMNEEIDDSVVAGSEVTLNINLTDASSLSIGEYIKIDSEIMKIINIGTTIVDGVEHGTLTVLRGQFGTTAVAHTNNNADIVKINVPKILTHINRPMLEKCNSNVILNRWVEDIQMPEPPNNYGESALSVFRGGKILASSSSTLLSGTIYPANPEKVNMSFIEAVDDDEEFVVVHTNAGGTTISTSSGNSGEQIVNLPVSTVGSTAVPDDFPGPFTIGKSVTITGMTDDAVPLNGIHEIVGLGADVVKIAVEAPTGYTEAHIDNSRLYLEGEVLSDDLKNKYILGMSYLYDGGGSETQESDVTIAHTFDPIIPQQESVFKTVGNWDTDGGDGSGFDANLLDAGSDGDGMQLLSGGVVVNNATNKVLGYTTNNITNGADYYVSVNVSSYTDGAAIVAVGQVGDGAEHLDISSAGTHTAKIAAGSTATIGVSIKFVVDGDGNAPSLTINSVQVWKATGTEMSATNALDLRTLTSAAKSSLSFLCNNSRTSSAQNNSWNERIEGFRIYMKQVDMMGGGLSDEFLLLYDVNIKDGTYICRAKGGDIETLRLSDIAGGNDWNATSTTDARAVVTTNLNGDSIKNVPLLTYEAENGYEAGTNLAAMYKTSAIVQRKVYIGNVKIGERTFPDRMMRSDIDRFDSFPNDGTHFIDVATSDGDSITKLESIGDKLIQFKKKIAYLIKVTTEGEELEANWPGAGVLSPSQVVSTTNGIVWANNNGLFLYNGEELNQVTADRFTYNEWQINENEDTPVLLGYDENSNKVIIQTLNTSNTNSGGFIYDLNTNSIIQCQKLFNWYVAEQGVITNDKIGPPIYVKGSGEGPEESL
jgi:hypothetical protein